jgi:hypothetical protein
MWSVGAPVLVTHPASQTVDVGEMVTFTVLASSAGTLSYQWRHNGDDIVAANDETYTILSVTSGDAGTYDVIVTNSCGSVTSDPATLTVNDSESCVGDLNGDDRVDLEDLAGLLSNYGTLSGATWTHGDFNADGRVDLEDLSLLLSRYGTVCP